MRGLAVTVWVGFLAAVWGGCSASPSAGRSFSESGTGAAGGTGGSQPDAGGAGGSTSDGSAPDGQDNPCIGVTCNKAPANECADATHLAVYDVPGTCDDGTCSYGTHEVYCEHGCEDAACDGDPCAGVTCKSPPANYCASADYLAVYEGTGSCEGGVCSYDSHQAYCEFGCSAGACEGDPCLGVLCETPPADYCSSAETLHEHDPNGYCSEGSCVYDAENTSCPHGCAQGACLECSVDTDCSDGTWCNSGSCKPCESNAHCGAQCEDCTDSADVCKDDFSGCVDCNVDGDCSASGAWCNANVCEPCNTNDHCGPFCVVCDAAHPCDGSACRCTSTSCGANNQCVNGTCEFCDSASACGAGCEACGSATPHCWVDGSSSSCVECLNDDQCGTGYVCDASHMCVYDPCVPPVVACSTGSEDRDDWSGARTIGRPEAASAGGYAISGSTCYESDDFNESDGCWDAGEDHSYRIYLRESEQITLFVDSDWSCDSGFGWDMTLSIYEATGGCLGTGEGSRVFCVEREYSHTETYTAPTDGWYYIIVDGSHAFDDEGDYDFQVELTCNAPGCGCS